jgi:hypothetical protein
MAEAFATPHLRARGVADKLSAAEADPFVTIEAPLAVLAAD